MPKTEVEPELDIKRIQQDIRLAAFNLNVALHNFERAGGASFLLANRLWLRLKDDTDQFLKDEGMAK